MARCDTLQHAARLWKDKAIALELALADLQTQVDTGTALSRGTAPRGTVKSSRLTVRAHDAAVAGERSPARGGLLHAALSHPASEEVLVNALATIFVAVDADSRNMVTAHDLRAFVSRGVGLGQGLSEQLCRLLAADGDLEAAMGAHDANKDGVMSVDEFVSMAVATLRSAEGSEPQPMSTSELPTGETKHAIRLKSEAPESKDKERRMMLPVSLGTHDLVSSTASGAFVQPPKEKTSAGFPPPLSSCTLPHEMEQSSESSITVESLKPLVGKQVVVAGRGGGSNEEHLTSDKRRKRSSREEANIAKVAGMLNDEGSIHANAATMPGVAVAQEGNSVENGVGREDEGAGAHGGHGMSRQEEVRYELVRLYTEFNPQNMENIDKLLDLYEVCCGAECVRASACSCGGMCRLDYAKRSSWRTAIVLAWFRIECVRLLVLNELLLARCSHLSTHSGYARRQCEACSIVRLHCLYHACCECEPHEKLQLQTQWQWHTMNAFSSAVYSFPHKQIDTVES
jgi:hypothetical protein